MFKANLPKNEQCSAIISEQKTPEFYQEEDFRVVIWRIEEANNDPNRSKADPKLIQTDPEKIDRLIRLIKENPSISRAELARVLKSSERQIRKMIDQLRAEKRLIRRGGTTGEWIIIEP